MRIGCIGVFSRLRNLINGGGSRQTIGDVPPTQAVNQSATQEQQVIGGVGATCRPKKSYQEGQGLMGLIMENNELGRDLMTSIMNKINDPKTLSNCLLTNTLLCDVYQGKYREFRRSVEDKLIPIRIKLANVNNGTEKSAMIKQELRELIKPDLSPESFIELEVAKKLINEFPNDIGNACQVAIKQLLELNRVDDAFSFFTSVPFKSDSSNQYKCLELLWPRVIQKETTMADINQLIGVNQWEGSHHIRRMSKIVLERLLELNRVDDALSFFNSFPLDDYQDWIRNDCLRLLLPRVIQKETHMENIKAWIGVDKWEDEGGFIKDTCECAINRLLELNRVDDACEFFKSIPLNPSDNTRAHIKSKFLVLLLPHFIQQKTPMKKIKALIGVDRLKKEVVGSSYSAFECAINRLLELNRVDDACEFFKSIRLNLSDRTEVNQKSMFLVLLLPHFIQQKTSMKKIKALIGVDRLKKEVVGFSYSACECAIKQLLELNRVDEAWKFFKSIPLSQNSNSFNEECLNLLNSYTNG